MKLEPHQQELLRWDPNLDPADLPLTWSGAADLDEQIEVRRQKRLAREAVKVKPAQAAAAPAPKKAKQFVTLKRHKADTAMLVDVFGAALAAYVAEKVEPLLKRITELEGERMKFAGVWKKGQAYAKGSFCTHGGSGWHCNNDSTAEPGTSADWTLAVKRGRDGKDGMPAKRMIHALA